MRGLNDSSQKPITVSVGMATGSVLAGNIGRRCDDGCSVDGSWNYDIIGSTVNKAARVSSAKLRSGTRRCGSSVNIIMTDHKKGERFRSQTCIRMLTTYVR